MEFDFLISDSIRSCWAIYKKHFWFFAVLALVNLILNTTLDKKYWVLNIIIALASIVWTFVWIKASLIAIDGQEDKLTLRNVQEFFPNWKQFGRLIVVGLLVGLSIIGGIVALIIPGIYVAIRLSFANRAFFDKNLSPKQAYLYSWRITKGKVFWTIFSVELVCIVLLILGILFFVVGIIITYPIIMMLNAKIYRELSNFYEKNNTPIEA